MADSPFAFEAPAPAASSSAGASLLAPYFPHSPLLPRLSQLASTLYTSTLDKRVRQQIGQLRGDLRDAYKAKARAVKADYMARLVPLEGVGEAEQDGNEGEAVETKLKSASLDESTPSTVDAAPPPPPLPPTILSDVDEAAAMSSRVDEQVEASVQAQLKEAEERIRSGTEKTVEMEVELWLGQAVLDAFDQAAGDETAAAKFVEAALEDRFFEEGIDLPSSA
ncbi:hypothetical protein JCM8097_005340 [Rhodosporidiobolus ruineniae]